MGEAFFTILLGCGYLGLATLFVLLVNFLSTMVIDFYRNKKHAKEFEEEEIEIWLP